MIAPAEPRGYCLAASFARSARKFSTDAVTVPETIFRLRPCADATTQRRCRTKWFVRHLSAFLRNPLTTDGELLYPWFVSSLSERGQRNVLRVGRACSTKLSSGARSALNQVRRGAWLRVQVPQPHNHRFYALSPEQRFTGFYLTLRDLAGRRARMAWRRRFPVRKQSRGRLSVSFAHSAFRDVVWCRRVGGGCCGRMISSASALTQIATAAGRAQKPNAEACSDQSSFGSVSSNSLVAVGPTG